MNFAIPSTGTTPGTALGTASAAAAATTATTAASLEHRKLTEAAQQFEGMLLQELLKPMQQHGFCEGENDDNSEGSGFADTLGSYGAEAMATAISKGGGLGIARRVVEQVEGEKAAHLADVGEKRGTPQKSSLLKPLNSSLEPLK